jgi:predicted Rossmann-fold nucleotide-binding protein
VGLLNHKGHYDGLLRFMEHTIAQEFMGPWQMSLIEVGDEPESLLRSLVQSAGLSSAAGLDQI